MVGRAIFLSDQGRILATMRALALAAVAGALAVVLGWWLVARLQAWARSRRARARARRALRGESHAEKLLVRRGFVIRDRQVTRRWTIDVDGEAFSVSLRADLLVERHSRTFVAEVKTGDEAPRISNVSTRRQLLEYLLAYEADGVLLVEPEAASVREITFPGL